MKLWKDARPNRSQIYVPMDKPKLITKAIKSPVDSIILDLEDAVSPVNKAQARINLAAIKHINFEDKQVTVRINGSDTPYFEDDLKALQALGNKLDAVIVPKAETAQTIETVHKALPSVPQWLIVETPKGIQNVDQLLADTKNYKVEATIFGTQDYGKDAGVDPDSDMVFARSKVLNASRANGIMSFDGVSRQTENPVLFKKQVALARELGFDGKNVIHPTQVKEVNASFYPTDEELVKATEMVDANKADPTKGVVKAPDGTLVEGLHLLIAKDVLRTREAVEALEARRDEARGH